MRTKLGPKSRGLLELFFLMGAEVLDAVSFDRGALIRSSSLESEAAYERCLALLKQKGWIVSVEDRSAEWVFALTDSGRDQLVDGIDPEAAWSASWDGKWRTISFDLPSAAGAARQQLRTWLQKRRFGHLQGSVWITHRPYQDWESEIQNRRIDPASVLFQESTPIGKVEHADYVRRAWNFDDINGEYRGYLAFLKSDPPATLRYDECAQWRLKESVAWRRCFEKDPFLPRGILPKGYLGERAWRSRRESYRVWLARLGSAGS